MPFIHGHYEKMQTDDTTLVEGERPCKILSSIDIIYHLDLSRAKASVHTFPSWSQIFSNFQIVNDKTKLLRVASDSVKSINSFPTVVIAGTTYWWGFSLLHHSVVIVKMLPIQ